jgi:hypothetical protein
MVNVQHLSLFKCLTNKTKKAWSNFLKVLNEAGKLKQ